MNIRPLSVMTNNTKQNFKSRKYNYNDDINQRNRRLCCDSDPVTPRPKPNPDKDLLVFLGCLSPILLWPLDFNTHEPVGQTDTFDKTEQEVYQAETPEESYNIVVNDVTGDETPDIVLYKKDGTKVIYKPAEDKVVDNDSDIE